MSATNIGRWDRYYRGWEKSKVHPFGCETTYRLGYEWLKDCPLIEDWGAGYGFFSSLCVPGQYRGLDCSCTPHAAEQVDLVNYRSQVQGIFMRHVLEHQQGQEWRAVLANALASFQQRMALVIFTPFAEVTTQIRWDDECKNPTWSFRLEDLTDLILSHQEHAEWQPIKYRLDRDIVTKTMFHVEHVFYLEKAWNV